jgi:hypothetical protein
MILVPRESEITSCFHPHYLLSYINLLCFRSSSWHASSVDPLLSSNAAVLGPYCYMCPLFLPFTLGRIQIWDLSFYEYRKRKKNMRNRHDIYAHPLAYFTFQTTPLISVQFLNVELNWNVFVKLNCGANRSTESLSAFLVSVNYADVSFRISFNRFSLRTLWCIGI